MTKKSNSLKTIVNISIKVRVFSDLLFVSIHGGGGVDGEWGVVNSGVGRGQQRGVSSTPKNRASNHKYKSVK